MTEAKIKERISRHFIGLMAATAGFKLISPEEDFGVDLLLEKVGYYWIRNSRRFFDTGRFLSVQVKCTSQEQAKASGEFLTFDIPVKNYNDLIWRKSQYEKRENMISPLILILVVLDEKNENWVVLSEDEESLILNGKAFWYYPFEETTLSKNKEKKRIKIPLENQIKLNILEKTFNLFYKKKNS